MFVLPQLIRDLHLNNLLSARFCGDELSKKDFLLCSVTYLRRLQANRTSWHLKKLHLLSVVIYEPVGKIGENLWWFQFTSKVIVENRKP